MQTESVESPRQNPLEIEDPIARQVAELRYLKSQFLASLNHQIRTPMSSIMGMVDLLLETQLDPRQKEYAMATRICAQELFDLLSGSLEFSSLTDGNLRLEEVEFDLIEVIESSLMEHAFQAESKGIHLVSNFSAELPQLAKGDPGRLRQLLSQFLSNAVKFTEHGYVELSAAAVPKSAGEFHLEVAVKDTGIGIIAEHQKHIFESFRQGADVAGRRFPGLGLGLAIAQKIVRLLGGEIQVSSEFGKGSVFSFWVPLRLTAENPRPVWDPSLAGKCVLVLHENPVVCRAVTSQLQHLPTTPYQANNLEQARQIMERQQWLGSPVWAVILDVDGLGEEPAKLSAQLRAISNSFLVSMVWQSKTGPLAGTTFFDAELAKPVRRYPLYDTLLALLARTAKPFQKPRRILIAEDNLVSQRLVTHILRRGGYDVDAVSSGPAAIDAVRSRDGDGYHLILMDLQMPGMTGLDAAQAIRTLEHCDSIPIVALTADTSEELRTECRNKGMNGYLVKPIKSEELLSAIGRLLNRTGAEV